jgi:hypothetical protein
MAKADKHPEIIKEIGKLQEVIRQMPNIQEKLAKYNMGFLQPVFSNRHNF